MYGRNNSNCGNDSSETSAALARFAKCIVRITDEYVEPVPLLEQGDRLILSRGNIGMITGKPKAFKTFLTSGIASGFMEDETLSISGPGGRCLIVDTEQSKAHVNRMQKRIYRLSGWDTATENGGLVMLSLREFSVEERINIALEFMSAWRPDLVIIDGIRDMIPDFNDLVRSAELVGKLMAVSTELDCGIICVLHQNKADSNARGHLGAELSNKCETVLQVKNEKGIANVEPVYSRNREIESFSFRVSDGLPELCSPPKVEAGIDQLTKLMRKAFFGSSWLDKNDLKTKLARLTKLSDKSVCRRIDKALTTGIIQQNSAHYYVLTQKTEENENEPLPF